MRIFALLAALAIGTLLGCAAGESPLLEQLQQVKDQQKRDNASNAAAIEQANNQAGLANANATLASAIATSRPTEHPMTIINNFVAGDTARWELFHKVGFYILILGVAAVALGFALKFLNVLTASIATLIYTIGLLVLAVGISVWTVTLAGAIAGPFEFWIALGLIVAGVIGGGVLLWIDRAKVEGMFASAVTAVKMAV